ncbi:hypothetical protein CPter91_3694 [Collimonas pratensis]|uniref:Uncharacterized protein n=1 Tax=Collimonas pratensis TaxID=279113 RepID=A0A127Q840_9BURK|nr:hypothetical protein CPter91_3694 [Collimonas pratensis]
MPLFLYHLLVLHLRYTRVTPNLYLNILNDGAPVVGRTAWQ